MFSNFQSGPQTTANDRQKAKIAQDDYIAITIANEQNIANARKQQFTMGVPQALTPIESMSPTQLLADDAGQEMLAQQNLKQLKFRDQEVSDILVNIRRDPQLSFLLLNANFPAIKNELEKRFNIKLVTPTFFVDFLKSYLSKVEKSLGLRQYARTKDGSVDTIEEIRTILPDVNDLQYLRQQAQNLNYDDVSLSKIDDLITIIPNDEEYMEIAALDPVTRQQGFQELLMLTRDLPTTSQISSLVQNIQNGIIDRRGFNDAFMKILNSINVTLRKPEFWKEIEPPPPRPTRQPPLTPPLQEIEKEMGQILKRRLEPQKQVEFQKEKQEESQLLKPITGRNNPAQLSITEIRSYLRANPNIASQLRDTNGQKVSISNLQKKMGNTGKKRSIYSTNLFEIWGQEMPTTEGFGIGKYNPIQTQPRNIVRMGKGIAAVEQPSYKEFGKFCINMNHLENQDILNIKYKNCLGAVPSFKPTAISDIFRDFIIDLLDTGKPNIRVYNQICDEERKHFQKLASAAGIFKGMGLPVTVIDDEEKDVKRFEILRGQIQAGNNNPKLLDETRKLVVRLMNSDRIKKKAGLDILLELSAM
jgi:hypothetical protein